MKIDRKEFEKAWNGNLAVREIRNAFGLSERQVRKFRDEYNLKKRKRGGVRVSEYPKTSESAYLLGVALGDGDLGIVGRTIRLRLFCDIKFPCLIDKWRNTCNAVLGCNSSVISWGKNCKAVMAYSKKLQEFPWKPRKGRKWEQNVRIPDWVKDGGFLIDCLVGLFEADGCIYTQRVKVGNRVYEYERVSFSNSAELLIRDVIDFLLDNGISHTVVERPVGGKTMINGKPVVSRTINYYIQIIDRDGFLDLVPFSKT